MNLAEESHRLNKPFKVCSHITFTFVPTSMSTLKSSTVSIGDANVDTDVDTNANFTCERTLSY